MVWAPGPVTSAAVFAFGFGAGSRWVPLPAAPPVPDAPEPPALQANSSPVADAPAEQHARGNNQSKRWRCLAPTARRRARLPAPGNVDLTPRQVGSVGGLDRSPPQQLPAQHPHVADVGRAERPSGQGERPAQHADMPDIGRAERLSYRLAATDFEAAPTPARFDRVWPVLLAAMALDALLLLPALYAARRCCASRSSVGSGPSVDEAPSPEAAGTVICEAAVPTTCGFAASDGEVEGAEETASTLQGGEPEDLGGSEAADSRGEDGSVAGDEGGSSCAYGDGVDPSASDADVVAQAQRLVYEPWVSDDPCVFAVFEEPREEAEYHRRRSGALCVVARAFLAVQEAGAGMVADYERLQREVSDAAGEAAYWRTLYEDALGGAPAEAAEDAPMPSEWTEAEQPQAPPCEEGAPHAAAACLAQLPEGGAMPQHPLAALRGGAGAGSSVGGGTGGSGSDTEAPEEDEAGVED
mmetsp:Transcript_55213/g.154983  ORF Transcript_55213/g.154983 Transcript_55213/m.154983 type:complete len:469 (+) Transcript_55213:73-1479(+)